MKKSLRSSLTLFIYNQADNPPETVAAEGKKPTVDKSFEVLLTKVEKYDEELVKGWKEDIDTLLVFVSSLVHRVDSL